MDMKKQSIPCRIILVFSIFYALQTSILAQYSMPEVLDTASLKEQFGYIEGRTRIYNDFRAIREDMFQRLSRNALDSLSAARKQIGALDRELNSTRQGADSLSGLLQESRQERDEAIRNRDSLSFLGISMNKLLYNTILWGIIAGLAFLAAILFLMFKGNHGRMTRAKKDLEELKEEFEAYRKQSRERYEKLVVSHHQEIKKLKEGR